MTADRSRRPAELWAYSPYWSDVKARVEAFDAAQTVLVPARGVDGRELGLCRADAEAVADRAEIVCNSRDVDGRFLHMKAYQIRYVQRWVTAVGSCNFTRAGLCGAAGNVEAMLVDEQDPDWELLGPTVDTKQLPDEAPPEEQAPQPAPVVMRVGYDWREPAWRVWLEPGSRQSEFVLLLAGQPRRPIGKGREQWTAAPPTRGATYTVEYREQGELRRWTGVVVEYNLDHSHRSYGRSLSVADILATWGGRPWGARDDDDDDDAEDGDARGSGSEAAGQDADGDAVGAFDAMNLYDFFRDVGALTRRIADLDGSPGVQRGLLVGAPTSVLALARKADAATTVPQICYLVLRELDALLRRHRALVDTAHLRWLAQRVAHARARTIAAVVEAGEAEPRQAEAMVEWFEHQLLAIDRRGA